jgi:hypothetical protein
MSVMGTGFDERGGQRRSADGVSRRLVVQGVVAVAAAALAGARAGVAWAWGVPIDRAPPSEADRRLAELGARLAGEAPETAAELADEVARHVRRGRPGTTPGAQARARFLQRDRIARELASGAVVGVDGWMLARSEAAVAAYLHRVDRHGAP